MERINQLKEFVTRIQEKVSIAVALAVIHTKPCNISAEEHAKIIQEKFYNYWKNVKRKEDSDFEDKIICLQQSKICNLLVDIVPTLPDKNSIDSCLVTSLVESQDSESENEFESKNAEFVYAIVRLKFAVDSMNTLPLHKVHTITRSILQQESGIRVTEIEDDSGFESYKRTVEEPKTQTSLISSSLFRPITHSSDTEFLITKSVESVLRYVHKQIMQNPEESFGKWQDSILEHVCLILKKAICIGNFCSDLIVALVQDILNGLWRSVDTNKHAIWECQCLLLAKFCCNENICTEMLNFLLVKLTELTDHIKFMSASSEKILDTYIIEKSPHLIQFNVALLKKWKKFRLQTTKQNERNELSERVNDLWKTKWQSIESGEHINNVESVTENWKRCYEQLWTACTKDFPLVALQVWDLIQEINTEMH